MDGHKIITIALTIFIVVNIATTVFLAHKTTTLNDRITSLENDQKAIDNMLIARSTTNNNTSGGEFATPSDATAETIFLGYDTQANEATAVPIKATSVPRNGIYTNMSSVDIQATVQQSWRQAAIQVAQTKYQTSQRGVLIELHAPKVWDYVRGGSSALPAATAIAGTNPGVSVNNSTALTGGLDKYGRVTDVKGIKAKAVAARESGKNTLVVPVGQGMDVEGIEIVEARTLRQALKIALKRN